MPSEVKLKKCKVCSSLFKPYRTTDRHCSYACAREDNALGLPQLVKIDYQLKEWSKKVRDRDGWKCQFPNGCREKLGKRNTLDAHHIKMRSQYPKEKYNVDNGITLCRTHHRWAHDHPKDAFDLGILFMAKLAAQML